MFYFYSVLPRISKRRLCSLFMAPEDLSGACCVNNNKRSLRRGGNGASQGGGRGRAFLNLLLGDWCKRTSLGARARFHQRRGNAPLRPKEAMVRPCYEHAGRVVLRQARCELRGREREREGGSWRARAAPVHSAFPLPLAHSSPGFLLPLSLFSLLLVPLSSSPCASSLARSQAAVHGCSG